jgi:hypothetical protein
MGPIKAPPVTDPHQEIERFANHTAGVYGAGSYVSLIMSCVRPVVGEKIGADTKLENVVVSRLIIPMPVARQMAQQVLQLTEPETPNPSTTN